MSERSSRRDFFRSSAQIGVGVAVAPIAPCLTAEAEARDRRAVALPRKPIGAVKEMKTGQPIVFNYPDEQSPCLLVKTGEACVGGVGADKDIVAYSMLCPHQGITLSYDPSKRSFRCGGHFSQFDAQMLGQMICGQATVKLPRIILELDQKSQQITASGVDGLIYGRVTNTKA